VYESNPRVGRPPRAAAAPGRPASPPSRLAPSVARRNFCEIGYRPAVCSFWVIYEFVAGNRLFILCHFPPELVHLIILDPK
jgi:hypothetical protein